MKILLKNCGNCNHSVELSGDEKKVLEVVIYFQFQAILTNVLHISWQSYCTKSNLAMKILLKNCCNCNLSVELSGDEKKVLEVVIYFQFQAILTNVLHISWQSYCTFQSQMTSKCLN